MPSQSQPLTSVETSSLSTSSLKPFCMQGFVWPAPANNYCTLDIRGLVQMAPLLDRVYLREILTMQQIMYIGQATRQVSMYLHQPDHPFPCGLYDTSTPPCDRLKAVVLPLINLLSHNIITSATCTPCRASSPYPPRQ